MEATKEAVVETAVETEGGKTSGMDMETEAEAEAGGDRDRGGGDNKYGDDEAVTLEEGGGTGSSGLP